MHFSRKDTKMNEKVISRKHGYPFFYHFSYDPWNRSKYVK